MKPKEIIASCIIGALAFIVLLVIAVQVFSGLGCGCVNLPTPEPFTLDEQNRAVSIAMNNTTVQNLITGVNYNIVGIYNYTMLNITYDPSTHQYYSDKIIGNKSGSVKIQFGDDGFPTGQQIPYWGDGYSGECDNYHMPDYLTVTVDMVGNCVKTIDHGGVGCNWNFNEDTIVIGPGSYWNKSIYVYSIESPDYTFEQHNNKFTTKIHSTDVPVIPMVLDRDNFEKFKNGQPYVTYAFNDRIVTNTYENHTIFPPNKELFYVIKNEDSNENAHISFTNDVDSRNLSY